MTSFSPEGYILIGGYFNARTSTLADYIYESERDAIFINFPDNYEVDQFITLRNNQDIYTNSYGEKLIDFTISTKMRILNGGNVEDFLGNFTYIGYNGVSTVAYVLASENVLMRFHIHAFTVEELTSLSDHTSPNVQ